MHISKCQSMKSTVKSLCTASFTGSEDHASSATGAVLLVRLLLEPTEMLCFSLSVLTTVAAGDCSTFLESLILPSVGSRPKYLTYQKVQSKDLTMQTQGFLFDYKLWSYRHLPESVVPLQNLKHLDVLSR